jgi:hypothetical protein
MLKLMLQPLCRAYEVLTEIGLCTPILHTADIIPSVYRMPCAIHTFCGELQYERFEDLPM